MIPLPREIKKSVFQYFPDPTTSPAVPKPHPQVVTCTIFNGEEWARGVAVCSPEDVPNLTLGKDMALRYALLSLKGRWRSIRPITDRRALGLLIKLRVPYTCHAERYPRLSFFERRRLFGRRMEPPGWRVQGVRKLVARMV